ncbi:hypothetical protein [Actinoplanes philippinensis]|uniref:hypothetical protein n=1 Tax=Actinoplanes philippinensis TaxID=35752 RepID=UPI00340BF456
MTARSLIIAVVVGVVTGLAGRFVAGHSRTVPVWLPVAAGVAAAVLATVLARMADSVRPGLPDLAVVVQVSFAVVTVAAVVATADRQAAARLDVPAGRWGHRAGRGRAS